MLTCDDVISELYSIWKWNEKKNEKTQNSITVDHVLFQNCDVYIYIFKEIWFLS